MYSDDKKRELIMKHYSTPLHKGSIEGVVPVENTSSTCADNGDIYIVIENNVIQELKHSSEGCAVFLSSVDIIANEILGKTVDQAKEIISNYEAMINGDNYSKEILGDLVIYNNVSKQLNRATCALTASAGYVTILNK